MAWYPFLTEWWRHCLHLRGLARGTTLSSAEPDGNHAEVRAWTAVVGGHLDLSPFANRAAAALAASARTCGDGMGLSAEPNEKVQK